MMINKVIKLRECGSDFSACGSAADGTPSFFITCAIESATSTDPVGVLGPVRSGDARLINSKAMGSFFSRMNSFNNAS